MHHHLPDSGSSLHGLEPTPRELLERLHIGLLARQGLVGGDSRDLLQVFDCRAREQSTAVGAGHEGAELAQGGVLQGGG